MWREVREGITSDRGWCPEGVGNGVMGRGGLG